MTSAAAILLALAGWAPTHSRGTECAGAACRPHADSITSATDAGGEGCSRNFSVGNGAIGQKTVKSPVQSSSRQSEELVFIVGSLPANDGGRAVAFPATKGPGINQARFLDALRAVEDWRGRDGAAGERGPYQITAAVWWLHFPNSPFAQARQEDPARACALKHVDWLRARLRAASIDDNAFNLALAWNAGVGAVLRGRAPVGAYEYAVRVVNIYDGLIGKNTLPKPAETTRRRYEDTFAVLILVSPACQLCSRTRVSAKARIIFEGTRRHRRVSANPPVPVPPLS